MNRTGTIEHSRYPEAIAQEPRIASEVGALHIRGPVPSPRNVPQILHEGRVAVEFGGLDEQDRFDAIVDRGLEGVEFGCDGVQCLLQRDSRQDAAIDAKNTLAGHHIRRRPTRDRPDIAGGST